MAINAIVHHEQYMSPFQQFGNTQRAVPDVVRGPPPVASPGADWSYLGARNGSILPQSPVPYSSPWSTPLPPNPHPNGPRRESILDMTPTIPHAPMVPNGGAVAPLQRPDQGNMQSPAQTMLQQPAPPTSASTLTQWLAQHISQMRRSPPSDSGTDGAQRPQRSYSFKIEMPDDGDSRDATPADQGKTRVENRERKQRWRRMNAERSEWAPLDVVAMLT